MRQTSRLAVPSLAPIVLLLLVACGAAPKVAPAPSSSAAAPTSPTTPTTPSSPAPVAAPTAPRVTAPPSDSLARALAARGRADSIAAIARAAKAAADAQAMMRSQLTIASPFDQGSSRIGLDARTFLDQKVAILAANPTVKLRITGHAYERGSEKENVALGLSRADSAKHYIVIQGIDAGRIETVGHAETRPPAGSADSTTAPLRVASFEIAASPPTLAVP